MALSRLSNPQDTVTAITAALWTSEFDNIYNNALALISPLTGTLDLNGFKLTNLAAGTAGSPSIPFSGDADTGLFRVGADEAGIAAAGAASMTFTNPASAVNYLKWSGSATGSAVTGTATGTDANIDVDVIAKGLGVLRFMPTGVVVPYLGTTAPTGWLLLTGLTIGSAASGATGRANADTERLFTFLWNNLADAQAPVSGGRGASAAADFAANKTLTLPDFRDRGVAGVSGTKVIGSTGGSTSYTPAGTNSAPTFTGTALPNTVYTLDNDGTATINNAGANISHFTGVLAVSTGAGANPRLKQTTVSASAGTPSGTVSAPTFTGTPATIQGPYLAMNAIIRM